VRLIIIRHGKAEADAPSGRDEDRPLKERGRQQARWLGRHFAPDPPRLIVSSGHTRALDTAALIQKHTKSPLMLDSRLELGHTVAHALDLIQEHAKTNHPLMLVGHNPQLAQLLWVLTKGPPIAPAELKTGQAAILDLDPADPLGRAAPIAQLRMPDD
jgi:phosphohistidine phosphatase